MSENESANGDGGGGNLVQYIVIRGDLKWPKGTKQSLIKKFIFKTALKTSIARCCASKYHRMCRVLSVRRPKINQIKFLVSFCLRVNERILM